MRINENTKISDLIKFNNNSIEALASINTHFEKLRNPVLRKILASRVSIRDAAKIGGVSVEVFFSKLSPLGFKCELSGNKTVSLQNIDRSGLLLKHSKVKDLDVRPVLAKGLDPFNEIMDAIKVLPQEYSLRVINSFEPTPLIRILEKKGYSCDSIQLSDSEFHTYIKRTAAAENIHVTDIHISSVDLSVLLRKYQDHLIYLDVRQLEMPQPMISILKSLESLPAENALFVRHKKVPQFLFPELAERNFSWSVDEKSENEVDLIIYRK